MHPFFRFIPFVMFAFALSFFLAGCGREPKLAPTPAVTLGPNGKPLPLMIAKASFFDGKLSAQVTLNQSKGRGGFRPAPIHGLPGPDDPPAGDDVTITPEMVDEMRSRRAESPIPPINLWLELTSAASDPLNVKIIDFDSDLGNFAVQPEQIALTPGQSVEAEPMISRLGVTSLKIPVTVTLQLNGKTETHVLTLQPVDSADKPPVTP